MINQTSIRCVQHGVVVRLVYEHALRQALNADESVCLPCIASESPESWSEPAQLKATSCRESAARLMARSMEPSDPESFAAVGPIVRALMAAENENHAAK